MDELFLNHNFGGELTTSILGFQKINLRVFDEEQLLNKSFNHSFISNTNYNSIINNLLDEIIKKINGLNTNMIKPGQTLKVMVRTEKRN